MGMAGCDSDVPSSSRGPTATGSHVRGGDRGPYEEAAKQLAPAVRALEDIIGERGENVAGGTLSTLYAGVARIHERLPHYDPDDVIAWLTRMDHELEPFAGRLVSMLDCALDQAAFDGICLGA
mgnify:CR=1 FL=1